MGGLDVRTGHHTLQHRRSLRRQEEEEKGGEGKSEERGGGGWGSMRQHTEGKFHILLSLSLCSSGKEHIGRYSFEEMTERFRYSSWERVEYE